MRAKRLKNIYKEPTIKPGNSQIHNEESIEEGFLVKDAITKKKRKYFKDVMGVKDQKSSQNSSFDNQMDTMFQERAFKLRIIVYICLTTNLVFQIASI